MPASRSAEILLALACGAFVFSPSACSSDKKEPPKVPHADERAALERDCNGGVAAACVRFGLLLEAAHAGPRDDARAVALYEKACKQDNLRGCDALGGAYENAFGGLEKNDQKSLELHTRACDGGYVEGCTSLAWLHANGSSIVPRDWPLAFELFRSSCEKGAMSACNAAGWMFETGRADRVDSAAAAVFYDRACQGRYAAACANLANLYAAGRGVTEDQDHAQELRRRACALGYHASCRR